MYDFLDDGGIIGLIGGIIEIVLIEYERNKNKNKNSISATKNHGIEIPEMKKKYEQTSDLDYDFCN